MFVELAILAVSVIINYVLRPKPPKIKPSSLEDFNIPTASADRCITLLFGTRILVDSNFVWYGDLKTKKIKKETGMFGGKTTVGYKYYMGMHLVPCLGPVDEFLELYAGEKLAWSKDIAQDGYSLVRDALLRLFGKTDDPAWTGPVTQSRRIYVSKDDLFGGEKKSGGVAGYLSILFGDADQQPNSYLQDKVSPDVPAYRGTLSLVAERMYVSANSPYVNPWWVKVRRIFKDWYPEKANVNGGANPAHIIYELIIDRSYGMGYSSTSIDDSAFRSAADVLYSEGFGLNFAWTQQTQVKDFIQVVLDHIHAMLRVDPFTGKFTLVLMRGDYEKSSLPLFDEDSVVEMASYQRRSISETVNEVTVVYHVGTKDQVVVVQDLANIQAQGYVVSSTNQYPGIDNQELAARVARRDLIASSSTLSQARLRVNRFGWNLLPGELFRLSWPDLGIDDVVFRVMALDQGTETDSTITVECIEDVFSLPSNTYIKPQPIGWIDPVQDPKPSPIRKMVEAPYWDLAQGLGSAEAQSLDPSVGYLQTLGTAPSGDATNYLLYTRQGSDDYVERVDGEFAATAVIVGAIGKTDTAVTYENEVDIYLAEVGTYAYLGDEIVILQAIDWENRSMTISRGVLDTVPQDHPAGERIWFAQNFLATDPTQYSSGESVDAKLLTVTGNGPLGEGSAPSDSLTFASRMIKPYPPGNVKINGDAYPSVVVGPIEITWAHRDRLQQIQHIVKQSEPSIGPESGTTYNLRLFGANKSRTPWTSRIAWSSVGVSNAPDSPPSEITVTENFWARFTGSFSAPIDGKYTFAIDSDDSSDLFIDGIHVLGWYGGHGMSGGWTHSVEVTLQAGDHTFELRMTQGIGSYGMAIAWKKPLDIGITAIPAQSFSDVYLDWNSVGGAFSHPTSKEEMDGLIEGSLQIRQEVGLTGTNYLISPDPPDSVIRFELESVRDGFVSQQRHSIEVERAGYGYNYGKYYGGI